MLGDLFKPVFTSTKRSVPCKSGVSFAICNVRDIKLNELTTDSLGNTLLETDTNIVF